MKFFLSLFVGMILLTSASEVEHSYSSNKTATPASCYTELGFWKSVTSSCDSHYKMDVYRVRCVGGAVKQYYYWSGPTNSMPFSSCPSRNGFFERIEFAYDPYLGKDLDSALRQMCACD